MKQRCTNPNNDRWSDYGGRGIAVCEEWLESFEAFRDWALANGYQDDLTIDRIDVNGNYEPSNCRWSTQKEQQNNRSNNMIVEHNGKTQTLKLWAEEMGINYHCLYARVERGWPMEKALTTPSRKTRELGI